MCERWGERDRERREGKENLEAKREGNASLFWLVDIYF